ncbi:hypothetical protein CMV_009324 [Castanea mollissima]|uniref:Thionin-like protein n=1 Tax=Castanea mollissima TaxID=60419 RepID=A0A8J4RKG1_9ROSI|nr:hypothetical protein CMV_009324 [Castanea mollissima]
MANKFVAAFLMCIVVMATFSNPAASDCYSECFNTCKARGDITLINCSLSCANSCEEYPGAATSKINQR